MWHYLAPVILLATGVGIYAAQESGNPVPELSWLDRISPVAEHLTVVTVLLFIIGALLREWLMVGATAKAQLKKVEDQAGADVRAAREGADGRVQQVRTDMQGAMDRQRLDFERQLNDMQRQFDQTGRDKDAELQRLRLEIDRVQTREQDWQQIALGALGGAERQGRMLERAVVQPLEQRLRGLLGPSEDPQGG